MNRALARVRELGGTRMHAMTDSSMSWRFYARYGYERRASVDLLDLYELAMGKQHEQGYVYSLDVAKKVEALAARPYDAAISRNDSTDPRATVPPR